MGCSASKLDNEDTVRRCKERRRLMKSAVFARHHLASAHADYLRNLRLTGSALSSFARHEPLLTVSHQTPAVLLNSNAPQPPEPQVLSYSASVSASGLGSGSVAGSGLGLGLGSGSGSVRRKVKKEKVRLPHILSEDSGTPMSGSRGGGEGFFYPTAFQSYASTPSQESSVWNWENFYPPSPPDSEFFNRKNADRERSDRGNYGNGDRVSERGFPVLGEGGDRASEWSFRGSGLSNGGGGDPVSERGFHGGGRDRVSERGFTVRGGGGDRASEQSFRGSGFNNGGGGERESVRSFSTRESRRGGGDGASERSFSGNYGHHLDADGEETETERSEYDFFNPYGAKKKAGFRMGSVVDEETEREEVQCSDWGDHDHYSTTTSSDEDDEVHDSGMRSNYQSSVRERDSVVEQPMQAPPPVMLKPKVGMKYGSVSSKAEEKLDDVGSMGSYRTGEISDMKIVVRHKDLKEIVDAIKENFEKAAAAGDQVSEMLEIGRAQLDKSFRQLKKTVYHSSSILSNLSSTWSSKPPLAVKYRLDASMLHEPGGSKSLCSTLERLLAWEKKLYEEVKAREGVKIEHEKKLSALQNQEYKGEDEAKIYKTKTSIKRLQSLIIVTSQAVTTTSTAIVGLRDSDLVPQLVELCHGFMYMWKSMHQYHEVQSNIVQQVRGLVNQASKGDSTSELHRQATRDLESAVSAWHSSFCRLIKFQRDFIHSIQGWFKLTLVPVTNDEINNQRETSSVYAFCDEWKLALDRVPDTVASEAIKSFINVVHVITVKQTDELKAKRRTETASKDLEKKASSLRSIEKKYYHSYSMVGIGLPDTGPDNGQVLDARDPLAEKKSELAACQRRVEDEMLKHATAVEVTRTMTLNNLQTGLPGVFQALASFSSLFTEALQTVCSRSYNI